MTNHSLTEYMSRSIESIVSEALRHTLQNPRETAFLLRYRQSAAQATRKRLAMEQLLQPVLHRLLCAGGRDLLRNRRQNHFDRQ